MKWGQGHAVSSETGYACLIQLKAMSLEFSTLGEQLEGETRPSLPMAKGSCEALIFNSATPLPSCTRESSYSNRQLGRARPMLGHAATETCLSVRFLRFSLTLSPRDHNLGVGLADGTPKTENLGIWSSVNEWHIKYCTYCEQR